MQFIYLLYLIHYICIHSSLCYIVTYILYTYDIHSTFILTYILQHRYTLWLRICRRDITSPFQLRKITMINKESCNTTNRPVGRLVAPLILKKYIFININININAFILLFKLIFINYIKLHRK